ncbi:NADH-quinone oxidoreductase subunit B family protein [Ovoidimarina sediminis]|uniref:NADH-quinone oxidoreductase subunit B family protein n=1 Tax=Ovoidimarina sediminis TaxID=3079856 RepID=UPI00290D176E|nr:HupU protein [Rhodophyticola sp. MJ-SS7]MDU8945457.1 HupU protein [Rhodophyticola sp. MJ-SS7]
MNLLWLQSAGCGGCTMSLLCAEDPNVLELLDDAGIDILWHPAISEATGAEARGLLDAILSGDTQLDILCVEGSIVTGPKGTGRYHILSGTGRPILDWCRDLAPMAKHVVAVGTCAAFGGITAAGGNPSGAVGLQFDGSHAGGALPPTFRSKSGMPVINVSGCPTHPDWVTETLLLLASGTLNERALDDFNRPRFYTDHLVHHACPKNEYYEYKASARHLSQLGCMMEHLGCIGTQAVGDCNIRPWNGSGSCTRGGYPCIACTSPEFEDPELTFTETPKLAGIPVGLPSDMPKAWFMALASLSKAATPKRISRNAQSDRIEVAPKPKRERS